MTWGGIAVSVYIPLRSATKCDILMIEIGKARAIRPTP